MVIGAGVKRIFSKFRSRMAILLAATLAAAVLTGLIFLIRAAVRRAEAKLYPLEYEGAIVDASAEYGLDPCLIAAVTATESGFDPGAVSSDGAVGLMQILPSTLEWICFRRGVEPDMTRLCDPDYNIDMGCWLLCYLVERYGDARLALIAYNAGYIRLEEWLASDEYCENGKLVTIPFAETRAYVEKITRLWGKYEKLYGDILYVD